MIMKRFSLVLMAILVALSTTACGKKKKNNGPLVAGAGLCGGVAGIPERRVRGDFGMGGAVIELDLYTSTAGALGAVGTLTIGDLTVFPGFFGPPMPFTTCLSSNGFTGFITRNTFSGDELSVMLRGENGTIIKLGQEGLWTVAGGNVLTGDVMLQIDGFGIMKLPYSLSP
jgi:hypothetical protein